MSHVAVDFETFYSSKRKISLRTMGVDEYLWHPEVEVYFVSIRTSEGYFDGHPSEFDWSQIDGLDWVSHNAAFDARVYRRLCADYPKLKKIKPRRWHCTANLVSWLGCKRDLKSSVMALFGADVDKDARKVMDGRTYQELRNGPHWGEIVEYANRDALWCYRLWEDFSSQWPEIERKISDMTTQQCLRGLPADKEYIDWAIGRLDRCCFDAKRRLPWANGTSEEKAVLSPIAVAEECRKLGITPPRSLAEDSDSCQLWELEHPDIPWVKAMRRYRKANLLRTKFEKMSSRIRKHDGRLDFSQKYCGTHTKRNSGDAGFNVHGFQRDAFACVDLEEGQDLRSIKDEDKVDMRRAICARPGARIAVADLAQIEPRALAWLVNDHAKLELIRQGLSVYHIHAVQTLGWPEEDDLKKKDPNKYLMCKMRVLGLSYGCGAERYVGYCWNTYGYRMSRRDAKTQVQDFRKKERLIVKLWDRLQAKLETSVGDDLVIELPSWNAQSYKDIKMVKGPRRNEYTATLAGGRRNRLWGSLLCENVVQAIARDCFYEKAVMLEDGGLPTLLPVHDEIVSDEFDESQSKEVLEFLTETMSAPCSWMPGLALGSEAKVSQHYFK